MFTDRTKIAVFTRGLHHFGGTHLRIFREVEVQNCCQTPLHLIQVRCS